VRTTLTLDDDVAAKLQAESRRAGRPFRDIVNETLRRGLAGQRRGAQRQMFKAVARDLGELGPGLSLERPLSTPEAEATVSSWLAQPSLEHVHCDWNRQRTGTLTRRAAARRPLPQSGRGGRWCGVSTQPELALMEGALTFVVSHARGLGLGVFGSKTFEQDPHSWQIQDLLGSAASGRDAAILDEPTRQRASRLIQTRKRIHAGRMLSEFPGGVPDLKPEEARDAKAIADQVVRRVLEWLERYPPPSQG